MSVRLYKLNKAVEIYFWLCPVALAAKQAGGWEIREDKDPPHGLSCDEARETGCCAATAIEGEKR